MIAIAAVAAAPAAAITDARIDDVSGCRHAGRARPAVPVDHGEAVGIGVDAQSREQPGGVGHVARPDEHRTPRDDASVGEFHPRQPVSVDDEPDDLAVDDAYPARRELRPFRSGRVAGVGKEDDIIGPLPDELGVRYRTGVRTEHAEGLIADLPTVAVRAVQQITAPAFAHTGNGGQVVAHTGRQEDAAGRQRLTARKTHDEPGLDLYHCAVDDLDVVSGDLFAAHLEEVRGRHSVA